jgi:hypothetical protein
MSDDIRFTDHAAARAFEYGLDHEQIIQALRGEHFKQPGVEHGSFIHYVKVGETPAKIVTGPHLTEPEKTAIITVLVLAGDARGCAA